MCVEDWAILGLETVLARVLTEHPAVSWAVFTEPFPTEPFFHRIFRLFGQASGALGKLDSKNNALILGYNRVETLE